MSKSSAVTSESIRFLDWPDAIPSMKLSQRPILIALAALLLAGCASGPKQGTGPAVWYKPGVTEQQQLIRQFAKCRMISNQGGSGLAGWNGASLLATAMADGGRRKDVLHDCLVSEGFMLVRQSEVPAGLPFVKE